MSSIRSTFIRHKTFYIVSKAYILSQLITCYTPSQYQAVPQKLRPCISPRSAHVGDNSLRAWKKPQLHCSWILFASSLDSSLLCLASTSHKMVLNPETSVETAQNPRFKTLGLLQLRLAFASPWISHRV